MRKPMITAGAFVLLLSCSDEARTEKAPAAQEVNLELFEQDPMPGTRPAPPAEPEPGMGSFNQSDTRSDADGDEVSIDLLDGTASSMLALTTNAPDVGRAISSSAAVQGSDTTKHFIRVADLRFRVKDVVQATLGIEDIVGAHGGWVTKTQLRSEPRGITTIPVSEDSLLEVSRYELVNTITLRVPNTELDSALRRIGRWVDLFEHRNILADDIRLRMMANAMAVRRAKAHSARVAHAIDDQGRKLKETLSAEEALQASEEKRDQSVLNNLELADRVAYSTVTVDIYQRTQIRREMIANERSIDGYRPSLWIRMGEALAQGWRLVELTITGLVAIWPIVLLVSGALLLLWRKNRTRKSSPTVPMVTPPPGGGPAPQ